MFLLDPSTWCSSSSPACPSDTWDLSPWSVGSVRPRGHACSQPSLPTFRLYWTQESLHHCPDSASSTCSGLVPKSVFPRVDRTARCVLLSLWVALEQLPVGSAGRTARLRSHATPRLFLGNRRTGAGTREDISVVGWMGAAMDSYPHL